MFEVKGKHNIAKVYAKTVEELAIEQIKQFLDQKFSADSKIAIMPDTHAGAGRLMSRKEARAKLSMAEFVETMKDVYTTCVTESTIDESPMAYKPMDEIVECIKDTCDVINIIKPTYNFKATE